ncbi:hypothetical protein RHGRI_000953 [Rhododendron griersonianum]|uniref:Uncharacterized protein n=1 Tax=Rhododendron griersonianum TaxID=479676 RepID=A0AAV6LJM5_9ERIC|nr:hypothetical protein RHGRI_000953 [Rhododendron griersonianum]
MSEIPHSFSIADHSAQSIESSPQISGSTLNSIMCTSIQIRNGIPIPAEIPSSNDSPIPEVKSIMSDRDTPSLPDLTFRAVVIGTAVTVILAQLKTKELFEEYVIQIPIVLIQLIFGFLVDRLMEAMLPTRVFQIPGIELRFSLNPGRFNSKEHTLIYACAFVGMMCPNTNIHKLAININYFRKDIYWPVAYMATLSSYSIEAAEISGPEPSEMFGPRIPRSFSISNDSAQSIEPFEISGPQISGPGYDRLHEEFDTGSARTHPKEEELEVSEPTNDHRLSN